MEEVKTIKIPGSITVDELATALGVSATHLIGQLFRAGMVVTINQKLDYETVVLVVEELGLKDVKIEKKETATKTGSAVRGLSKDAVARAPIVAIMGHVDHGKTSLLDKLLRKDTVSGEAGGITQHISAYQMDADGRVITFLDTPGHEAFAAIRQHGAELTDIVIIVVAADDGPKPQTGEAIRFAREAGARMVVALNKIDKPGADINRTMTSLANDYNLMPEEWGGDTIMVPVSARTGEGLDKLVEMILLVADVEELKADVDTPAAGLVIESHVETGKGATVSLLVTGGELRVGEFIVAGSTYAKIRTMVDWKGRPKGKALPSTPVTVTGFKALPDFGVEFIEVPDEKIARKQALLNENGVAVVDSNVTTSDIFRMMDSADNAASFSVIIKADTLGSVQSVVDSLKMIDTKGLVNFSVAMTGVGSISENDIYMAAGENVKVYGFNVELPVMVAKLAARDGVRVATYKVIYELIEDVRQEMEALLPDETIEVEMGELKVLGVFRTTARESIFGGEMLRGDVKVGYVAQVWRDKELVGEGMVEGVQRGKVSTDVLSQGEVGGVSMKTDGKILVLEGDRVKFVKRETKKQTL